mgnify:CR=1 FL=1
MSTEDEKVQYVVFLPQEADDLITDVVLAYNKKVTPAQHITNEVYVNWIFRDWYVQMAVQKAQRESQAREIERVKNLWLETFKTKK